MNTTISDTALRQAAQRLAYQLSAALPDDHGGHRLSVPGLTKRRSMDGERPDMASEGICNGI